MATFPLQPDRVENSGIEFKTTKVDFETGYTQRSPDWLNGKRKFTLSWHLMGNADKDTLMTFFTTQKGDYGTFTLDSTVHPRFATPITARFASNAIRFNHINAYFSDVEVEVIEDA